MDVMDDSELAFVMSHEMMHGEKHHAIDGVMKGLAISTAVDVALNGKANALDILLGTLVVNYIDNEMVTMNQEKEADASGFEVFKKTDYNVGAAPASMVLVYEKYGDLFSEGWNRVISPNNHPQMTSRIQKLGNRVTKWSGNRVQVGGATVYLNALPIVTPAADGVYSSRRRAYLVAGNLARLCHNVYGEAENNKDFAKKNVKLLSSGTETWNVSQNGNDVVVNDMRVMTCTANDDGSAIVKSLDTALHAKAAKLPDKELVKQDTQWLKVNGYKEKKATVKDKKAQDTHQTDKDSDQKTDKTDKTEAA
jgi:predicted Zn-dependent protease